MKNKVRLSVDLSASLMETLGKCSASLGITKAEVLRRAITLYELCVDARNRGERTVLVDTQDRITVRFGL